MNAKASRVRYFVVLFLCLAAIVGTRYHEIDLPLFRLLKGPNRVDPLTLHLSGEFVEDNLGVRRDADGTLTLRMIAEQYFFIPHCVELPEGVPVRLRITSADTVHRLKISNTDYSVHVVPGSVSQALLEFPQTGEFSVPCQEFCGAGHYDMRSRMVVVPKGQFSFSNSNTTARGNCAAK